MAYEFSERDIELRAQILDIIANNDIMFMTKYPNVIGVGLGQKYMDGEATGLPTLSFLVSKKIPRNCLAKEDRIPQVFDGVITDVYEVGIVVPGNQNNTNCKRVSNCKPSCKSASNCKPSCKSVSDCKSSCKCRHTCKSSCRCVKMRKNNGDNGLNLDGYNKKYRPAYGGVCIGRANADNVGTLGIGVKDDQNIYILSNNHVMAGNIGPIGTPIMQSSNEYGLVKKDKIAELSKFVPIEFITPTTMPTNKVDAAIAVVGPLSKDKKIATTLLAPSLHNGPKITGTYCPDFRDRVFKIGADSELTTGQVLFESVSITIPYGSGQIAYFKGQISTTKMSDTKDAGSIGFDGHNNAFGLNFASSSEISIYSPIDEVLTLLDISFWNL